MTAGPERRSFVRLPREQRMRDIETAAREVFARHGFDAAPINEIASLAGISEGTIYKFYASKRDLLHTILKSWYEGMIAEFKSKLSGIEDTRSRLHVIIWQHLKSIKDNPDLCRLFYAEVRSANDYYSSDLYQMNREYTQVLTDVVRTGIERGEIRRDISIALVRDVIFGGVEHRVSGFLLGRSDFDLDEMATQFSEMVFAGIATPAEAAPDIDALLKRLEKVADRLDPPAGGGG